MSSSSGPVIWKVIQDLNGNPDANTPNEAISHEGRTITDIKSKANIFINHYAWVNKLNMSHPIAISTGNSGNVSKHHLLTMKDVLHFNWVNYYLPSKRWKVKEQLVLTTSPFISQVNRSFGTLALSLAHCPWIWRVATIIPLLRAWKFPSEVASFHPVSLT